MYTKPDFIKIEVSSNQAFAGSTTNCYPGTKINNVDYGGTDLSGCLPQVIAGESNSWECWYHPDEP